MEKALHSFSARNCRRDRAVSTAFSVPLRSTPKVVETLYLIFVFIFYLNWVISIYNAEIVNEKYQGMGLGKALCCDTMNIFEEQGQFPVYIHTQPWSYKAIFLYLSLGFKLQKTDTFSHYTNEYHKAMATLKRVVTDEQFVLLTELSEE